MTRDDTKRLMAIIVGAYTNFKPDDMKLTVDVWSTLLADYDFDGIVMALQAYITSDTKGFPPNVGQILEKYNAIKNPQQMNGQEAWALVSKALRNGYYKAQEEYDNLPPVVQKAVGSPSNLHNWSMTDEKTVETVIASNFMKSYEVECKRERELQTMPLNIKTLIEGINQRLIKANE